MTGMEGMPQAQQMAGGGYGYSAAPIYQQSLAGLQSNAPAQYDLIRGMFIDPRTGQRPNAPFSQGGTIYEALPEEDRQGLDTPFVVNRGIPLPEDQTAQTQTIQTQGPTQGPTPEQQAAAQSAYNRRIGLTPQMISRGLTAGDVMGR